MSDEGNRQLSSARGTHAGQNIPTVAGETQGGVINFVQTALAKLAAAGKTVLLEGREQTLNYIRTPHRFELVLNDPEEIGRRRAAQVMAAMAHQQLSQQAGDRPGATPADEAVMAALDKALAAMAAEQQGK